MCDFIRFNTWTTLFLLLTATAAAGDVSGHLSIIELRSEIYENTRSLRVWLPNEYFTAGNESRQFPVVYMNDGQSLFDARTAVYWTEEWRVDETMSRLISEGAIEPHIVVGIDHAGRKDRPREYLPWPDEHLSPYEPSPKGAWYARFLAREVIPLVESRYRAIRSRASRTLGGSSYGALVALYVGITEPQLFGALLLESPSFYVNDYQVLKDASNASWNSTRVHLGVGTNEIGVANCGTHVVNEEAVTGVTRLAHIMRNSEMHDQQVQVVIEQCAEHRPSAWGRRLPAALQFLLP